MILDLDIGNSRVKWRVTFADGSKGSVGSVCIRDLQDNTFRPVDSAVQRIRVSSVRAGDIRDAVLAWAKDVYGVLPEHAVATRQVGRVRNSYEDPKMLGVDRWLAMLAAFQNAEGAVCVFDFGSAMTADMVDGGGLHVGGFIAPGMRLMCDSLLAGTDLVRFSHKGVVAELRPATHTRGAVEGGVLAAAAGFANTCWRTFQRSVCQARAVVTGGDAPDVLPLLEFSASLEPALVLDGLELALPRSPSG